MEINDFLSFARDYMNEQGLSTWKLVIDRAKTRNGVCHHSQKTLGFSEHFIKNNPQSMIFNTIIHEIAHALVGHKHGHDSVWRSKCAELGYHNPTRCTASDMPEGKWQAFCQNCNKVISTQHRKPKYLTVADYTHKRCGSKITWKIR